MANSRRLMKQKPKPNPGVDFKNVAAEHKARVTPPIRTFSTGATRDTDTTKIDFEGFLSPSAIEAFGHYMHRNRYLKDGSIRDSDNWQKGIPLSVYLKSLFRHFHSLWKAWRVTDILPTSDLEAEDTSYLIEHLCGVQFNAQGMLHELIKQNPAAYAKFVTRMEREAQS